MFEVHITQKLLLRSTSNLVRIFVINWASALPSLVLSGQKLQKLLVKIENAAITVKMLRERDATVLHCNVIIHHSTSKRIERA